MLEAAHVALFAERLGPLLMNAEDALAANTRGLSPTDAARVVRAKVAAAEQRTVLRTALGLDDG